MEIIHRHGWSLHSEGYTVQSAGMNALAAELQKEPGTSYIQTCEMHEWFQQMIDAEAAFEKTDRESEELDAQQKPLITSSRKALYKDLCSTLNFIEGQVEFNASDELNLLVNNINQVITYITATAKARNTRKQSAEDNGE